MDIQGLISKYTDWLKSEITFEKYGEYYEITTPFMDNANDYLQLYVKQENDIIYFSDDGKVAYDLKIKGVSLNSSKREFINRTLFSYGVQLQNNELTAKASISDFPRKKHLFIQAMLKIEDLFDSSKVVSQPYFVENVQEFFRKNDIYYTENVQFTGISGFTHTYDFLLQRSKNRPERLCRAINRPSKNYMANVLFAWNDTKPSRRDDSCLIVVLNDENKIPQGVEEGFANYRAEVIRWSQINTRKNLSLLSAV